MLTRFALLAVVTVALASLAEAKKENACGVALSPDEFEQTIIARATADCESSNNKRKCWAEHRGWVSNSIFDEVAFRSYIENKIAFQQIDDPKKKMHVKTHLEGAIDGCLTAKNMEKYRIKKIMSCLVKDC